MMNEYNTPKKIRQLEEFSNLSIYDMGWKAYKSLRHKKKLCSWNGVLTLSRILSKFIDISFNCSQVIGLKVTLLTEEKISFVFW